MGDASVNGDMPHSATLSHLNEYHFVTDSVDAFKNNQFGQKSIQLTNAAYSNFVKPTFPYLETPAGYVKPYAMKIDEFGDLILTKVDERVPIVKSETKEIQGKIREIAFYPVVLASDTKDYVLSTYQDEYKKCGGDGLVAGGKALVTSSLVMTSEALNWLSSFLAAKKEEAKETAEGAKKEVEKKMDE